MLLEVNESPLVLGVEVMGDLRKSFSDVLGTGQLVVDGGQSGQ